MAAVRGQLKLRICEEPGCGVILAECNHGKKCFRHKNKVPKDYDGKRNLYGLFGSLCVGRCLECNFNKVQAQYNGFPLPVDCGNCFSGEEFPSSYSDFDIPPDMLLTVILK